MNASRAQILASALLVAALGGCGGQRSSAPPTASGWTELDPDPSLAATATTVTTARATRAAADTTHAYFTYPAFGQLATGSSVVFQWTSVTGAVAYQLQVGTTPGGSDLLDSGAVPTLSLRVDNLPAGRPIYARIRGLLPYSLPEEPDGHWRVGSGVTFRVDDAVSGATLVTPAQGVPTSSKVAIHWTQDPLAIGYRLRVGTGDGANDIDDSGVINVDMRLEDYSRTVSQGLQTVYVTLETVYSTKTIARHQSFAVASGTASTADHVAVARWLTAEIRNAANLDNQPREGSLLDATADQYLVGNVNCTLFAATLLRALTQANFGLSARSVGMCLAPNQYDCHELVEYLDPDTNRWLMLDATFGLLALDSAGAPLTAQELSDLVRAQNWSGMKFQFLTDEADLYARIYYLDYPLMFLDVFTPDRTAFLEPIVTDLTPYLSNDGVVVTNSWFSYTMQCASGYSNVTVLQDGATRTYPCLASTGLSYVVLARNLSAVPGDTSLAAIWQPRRPVFQFSSIL